MKKNVSIVVGGQFGSEAKGKIVQYLAPEFDTAIRGGSPNAGHTVIDPKDEKIYKLRQIPATFLNPNCKLMIGAGAVIDKNVLLEEIAETDTKSRIIVDQYATIIEEHHKLNEIKLVNSIGSTGRGCGAAMADRVLRGSNVNLVKNDSFFRKIT